MCSRAAAACSSSSARIGRRSAIGVQQVNWAQLNANGVTDWHRHALQTDHLVGVGGNYPVGAVGWPRSLADPRRERGIPAGRLAAGDGDRAAGSLARPAQRKRHAGGLPQHGRPALRLCPARQLPAGAGHRREFPISSDFGEAFRLTMLTTDRGSRPQAIALASSASASTSSISARRSARPDTTRACRGTNGPISRPSRPFCVAPRPSRDSIRCMTARSGQSRGRCPVAPGVDAAVLQDRR